MRFKNQVTIEPHMQTCPQPTVKVDPTDKHPSSRLATHLCTRPASSSSRTNLREPMNRLSINSAQTISNLRLWLRPRSTELKEYERRVGELASTGTGNFLSTLKVNNGGSLHIAASVTKPERFNRGTNQNLPQHMSGAFIADHSETRGLLCHSGRHTP